MVFLAAPLAAKGLPIARPIAETLVFAVLVIVAMLSRRRGAVALIALGLAAALAALSAESQLSPLAASVLRNGGSILTFLALSWVVSHAVYAPGRITLNRLQGAVVLYLNFAIVFASAFTLIWELNPTAFSNLPAQIGHPSDFAVMLYFSLTTLTTTGYGDIVPVDPFARSLANLESMIGLFYIAITIARLVTLETQDRRR
jgi:hypothetical protein